MVWRNIEIALVSTVFSLVLGVWLGWIVANRQFPGRREVPLVFTTLLALPAPILCYALLWRRPAGLSMFGFMAAAVLSAAPILIRAGIVKFSGLDPVYAKAARSLGTPEWRVFLVVELPLVYRAALAAAGLAFARVLLELAAVLLIIDRLPR